MLGSVCEGVCKHFLCKNASVMLMSGSTDPFKSVRQADRGGFFQPVKIPQKQHKNAATHFSAPHVTASLSHAHTFSCRKQQLSD